MIYNKVTLAFTGSIERLFLQKYFSAMIFQFRIAWLLVTILYASFGYLDPLLVPEYYHIFHIIRYVFVVPFLLIVFALSYTRFFSRIWQVLIFSGFLFGGAGISIMIMLSPDNYVYYAGMMLIFSAGYFFIKLRFFLATIAGWTTLLLFNIGAVFYAHSSVLMLVSNNFFYIAANIIGMFAAYNIEYYMRRDFFMNQELDRQRADVENSNRNLEKTVKERTIELMDAKNRAEQNDRLKSAFLANMSHEIRTPMNGILGFAELLKEPDLTGEKQKEYIRIIEKSGTRMLNIINNIIDISKIESGLYKVEIAETNINQQIDYIYSFFKPEVENKGMQLYAYKFLPETEALIKTDREKFYAILINLVKNAIKYSKQGSIEFGYEIIVDTRHALYDAGHALYLQFYVKDTGIGIAADRQEAIFERFIQADIADKQAYQGAGLGLSISKAFVEMLGGKMWVKSELGKGSCFYFNLPYIQVENKAYTVPDKTKNTDNGMTKVSKKLKILIVEDDEPSELLISEIVDSYGEKPLKVKNGIEAVEVCRNNPDIDLVLMDIQMPEMDGYEAARNIRGFNKNVIIIAQTAYGLAGDREKALFAGCNEYISKPLNVSDLKKLIQTNFS
jgi:signal transduction histidine kinase/CheY-like chemotaxis protein